ncbi:hypothetical protein LINGRAHAP2_LOCUS12444 [Linum grandiflorum]
MEELRKLEELQLMLNFTKSHGLASASDSDSSLFISKFILFLMEPCGELDTGKKFGLIREHLHLFSDLIVQEASSLLLKSDSRIPMEIEPAKGNQESRADGVFLPDSDGKSIESPTNLDGVAVIQLDAMQRANSTLEDFCRSYFMFHAMDVNKPELLFKYLPILSFTESYIYQMDSWNEKIVNVEKTKISCLGRGFEEAMNFADILKNDPFRPLVVQLEYHGLLTERIREELKCGEEYWSLERKLCSALANQQEIHVEEVMRAIHLKSFDYRILNLLLYQLRREQVNDLHMDFLSVSEFLVEIADDLSTCNFHRFDYEDDVLENSFNILRMFVKIYGPSRAPAMLAKCIGEAEEKYERLLEALEPQLSSSYKRRCEEATREGGKSSGNPLGTWSIPHIIADEESYRAMCSNS